MESLRFPVQSVIRPDARFSRICRARCKRNRSTGDEVLALPSRRRTRVESIVSFDGDLAAASASDSVVLKLSHEIDLSRGEMLVAPDALPNISNRFAAMVVWLQRDASRAEPQLFGKACGPHREGAGQKNQVPGRHQHTRGDAAPRLEMNEIGLVDFETSQPLFVDSYASNRTTGSLILIDPLSNATVGAVMIRDDRHEDSVFAAETHDVTSRNERRGGAIGRRLSSRVAAVHKRRCSKRALWEQGLDAISVLAEQASVANELFRRFWELGLVFVIGDEFDENRIDHEFLGNVAGDFYFELASTRIAVLAGRLFR